MIYSGLGPTDSLTVAGSHYIIFYFSSSKCVHKQPLNYFSFFVVKLIVCFKDYFC